MAESLQQIGNGAFKGCASLKEAVLTEGVSQIGEETFMDCSELISVTLPKTIQTIGNDAFANCSRLVEVYNLSGLQIKVGSSENGSIGLYAIDVYTSLAEKSKLSNVDGMLYRKGDKNYVVRYYGTESSVVVAEGTHVINRNAFEGRAIESVTLPKSLEEIGDYAFNNTALSAVVIPQRVTKIGAYAFANNRSLTSADISNCQIAELCDHVFYNAAITSIAIPSTVTTIGYGAFAGCESITSITLPFVGDGTTGEEAKTHFGYVFGAETANDHHRTDGTRAVPASLKNITILGGTIAAYAFLKYDRVENITFGKDVSQIAPEAFWLSGDINDDKYAIIGVYWDRYEQVLQSFSVSADSTYFKSVEGVLYSKDGKQLIAYPSGNSAETFSVPNDVEEIAAYAFYAQKCLKTLNIGDGVQKFGFKAFAGCGAMSTFNFGTKGALKEIGQSAFGKCYSLSGEIVIPEGVTTVGRYAFSGPYVDRIVLPSTLEFIGAYGFSNAAGRVKFNTTCDWDLRNGGYGYGNTEVTADSLENEEQAAQLLCEETLRFRDWFKRTTTA